MLSKEVAMEAKEAIIRLSEWQQKFYKKKLFILKKKEHTGKLRNIKRPGWAWKTAIVTDGKILSLVKNTSFQTSSQGKNTF